MPLSLLHDPNQHRLMPGEAWGDRDGFRSFLETRTAPRRAYPNEALDDSREAARDEAESKADWAALGYEVIKDVIDPLTKGGVTTNFDERLIGVRKPDKPRLEYQWSRKSRRIFQLRRTRYIGAESVNLKLDAYVRYNGPEVLVSLRFPAGGRRSRLGAETKITVGALAPFKMLRAPDGWRRLGVLQFPVVEVPVSIFVDDLWPNPNHEETFSLMLSGWSGLGAPGIPWRKYRSVRRT